MNKAARPSSRGCSRRTNHHNTDTIYQQSPYEDDEDRQVTEYEEDDDDTLDGEGRSFYSCFEPPKSTAEVVEESNMQVLFSETTSQEMDEILKWWTSKAWMEDDNQIKLAATNTLLRIEESKEEEVDKQVNLVAEDDEDEVNAIVNCRPLLVNLDSEETELLNLSDDQDRLAQENESIVKVQTPRGSTNLLVDQPLPQDVAFFSPFRGDRVGAVSVNDTPPPDDASLDLSLEDATICSNRSLSGPEELHESVCMQHDEVTRLLYQTRAMADQVAALTETSATEDDDDDSSDNNEVSKLISKLPPRRAIRRRRRKTVNVESMLLKPSSTTEDSTCVTLDWHHHGRIWLFRQFMKLEMLFVSQVLVPLLPLPFLLRVLHRPKTLRSLLLIAILSVTVVLPLFVWWYCPTHSATTKAPLPSVDLFINYEPYYASELRYSFQAASSTNVVREVFVFVEGDTDFEFL